jgi:outer membrane protein assembly factor BamB
VLADGKEKWKWTGDAPSYSSPMLMTVGGSKVVIAMTDTRLVALNVADGKAMWETPFAVQGRGYNAATPIVDGATLIYSGSGRGATAVKLEKKDSGLAATELWKNTDNSVMFNSPVLKNGLLFGFSAGNDFFCVKTSDGKTAWTAPSASAASGTPGDSGGGGGGRRMGGGMGRGGFGSIVDAGSVLVALSPAMELIAFEPTDKAYTEVARIKVAETPTYAYPVLAGDRLFIKDQDSVALYTLK